MDMVHIPYTRRFKKIPRVLTIRFRSIVISVFAIVILSAIGSMFAHGHHSMMGSTEDPSDGGKVATAVFGAVAVYGVRSIPGRWTRREDLRCRVGRTIS